MSDTIDIKMNTLYAGPLGLHEAGSVWKCPRAEAQGLMEGGYAVQVESAPAEGAETEPGDETANARETTAAARPTAETPEVTRERGFVKPKGK